MTRSASPPAENTQTPVMRQYTAAKQAHPNALLFFRLGDFYELFFDDAVLVSRELQLTLTARDKEKSIPMCGVPHHAAEIYLQRLLRKGYRIALCEQMEDPKTTKTIVRREVTRVLTPGTALDSSLEGEQNNFLAAVTPLQNGAIGLAVLDLSTGDFRATEFSGSGAGALCLEELRRIQPTELLLPDTQPLLQAQPMLDGESEGLDEFARTKTALEDWAFAPDYAIPLLTAQMKVHSLDGFGLANHPAAACAAGALLHYVRATQKNGSDEGALGHIQGLRYYEQSTSLELDAVSVRNLELIEPIFSGESQKTTLFHTLDACLTPMGKRMLRANILRPLLDAATINARLDAVAELTASIQQREAMRRALDGVLDLERLLARVALDSAGPRDILSLGLTLDRLPAIVAAAQALRSAQWQQLAANCDPLVDLSAGVRDTLSDDPPLHLADGGAIRAGVDAKLDELRTLSHSGRESIAAIEARERTRTGIGSLKVRFNNIFGYYIEITKSNLAGVPADYERKQTLVNAERFTTPELKDYETKILTAQERSIEIERRIFSELRRDLIAAAARIRESARRVAEMDMLSTFAHLAAERNYTRPVVDDSPLLEFVNARHPVVELRLQQNGGRFVPNNLHLDADVTNTTAPAILLLTGPNMGGKSTYLRQAALLVIMAQIGCFVPADKMHCGLVDRIYTRIGASDNVARGRSTFMVEMTETAAILNSATRRSLVLLDEMGRGTATYDGLSLAWATVEHLHNVIGARTLFATHYHELTLLGDQLPHLRNLRVTVKETANGIVFLHTVEAGAASKSYGIEVARLAGLPQTVIARARQVLRLHERAETQSVREATAPIETKLQMTIFTPLSQRIVDRLQAADVNALTPLQALNLLEELRREIQKGGGE
ncbi:MAG TPA: DNA mismatch repair protein MutS [Acidobacteriaceae bacterium]|nr:DNA mismatch repair protein MutS [Acidobacteriaceae bacterium]